MIRGLFEVFSDALVRDIADDLISVGASMIKDGEGRRLIITTTNKLSLQGDEMVLAYEGRGAILFKLDRPMNRFRLLANGFPEKVADSITDMVNRLIPVLVEKRQEDAAKTALERPPT